MKIRTQFYIFMTGIILIPLLVILGILFAEHYRRGENYLVPDYDEVSKITQEAISEYDWTRLMHFLSHKPEQLEFMVLDKDEVLLFSSIEDKLFKMGDTITAQNLFDLTTQTGSEYFYQIEYLNANSESEIILLTRFPKSLSKMPNNFVAFARLFVLVMIFILTFCAILLTHIIRSVTSSVQVLEKATKRIANGEFELEIDVQGNNEILSLTDSLNKMRLALLDDQKKRARFIMGVSHDLRTPLALIKGYTEVISDGLADDPEVLGKSLAIIDNKIDQLDGLIDDLINYVKLDTGDWQKHLTPQNLYESLNNFAKRFSSDASILQRKASYEIAIPHNTVIPFEEKLLMRALENLTGNAIRYTNPNDNITLSATGSKEQGIEIKLSDTGIGIKSEELHLVIEPFFRGSNSRREDGSGLGLSIVKSVVDSHGWTLAITSEFKKGTEIAIKIPKQET